MLKMKKMQKNGKINKTEVYKEILDEICDEIEKRCKFLLILAIENANQSITLGDGWFSNRKNL